MVKLILINENNNNMKGFGFPGKTNGTGSNPSPSYRADTSKQKSELIFILKKSEQLWND
jgi:hypothetical protein